jgi:hypothetical protein
MTQRSNADRTLQVESNFGALDSRRLKNRNVDSSSSSHIGTRSKGTDVNNFSIEDRDANSIISSEQ